MDDFNKDNIGGKYDGKYLFTTIQKCKWRCGLILNKDFCYSFTLQHKDNRIITPSLKT